MTPDRPFLGILLMLGFCVVAPLSDSIAKLLAAHMPLVTLIAVRFAFQAVVLLPFALAARQPLWWPRTITLLVAARTALHIAGVGMMFAALRYLPVADAIAIAFVMPFILLLLSRFFLGEEIGSRRIAACCVGFIGTLMVMQPSFAAVGAPALLPVGVAIIFALFMLVTRQIARLTDPAAMQCTSGAMASVVLVPLALLWPSEPEPTGELTAVTIWLLVALGILGTGGHLLMTWSLRYAPAATLAPMQYLEIPFAAVFGWLIFRDFPNGLALIGIIVTIMAGLYIIARERRLSQARAPA